MKTKFEDLSKELRDELFKRHTHNELVNDPSAIIYHEEDVIEIIDIVVKQERNKAIDVQKILTNSEGINHLKWIYDRMIYVIGENPNMDYMHKFKSIIEKLTAHGEH